MEISMRAYGFMIAGVMAFAMPTPAVSAEEPCKGDPKSQWKSVEQVKKAAMENGFTKITKVILEDGCYEVVTLNDQGKIVGVHFDPVTLKLHKVEAPR
jgi:hypothetical protein